MFGVDTGDVVSCAVIRALAVVEQCPAGARAVLALERARTFLATYTAPSVPGQDGNLPAPPRTYAETVAIRTGEDTIAQRLIDAAVTLIMAGGSLGRVYYETLGAGLTAALLIILLTLPLLRRMSAPGNIRFE